MVEQPQSRLLVVAPVYNEAGPLAEFVDRCLTVFADLTMQCNLLLVDDGSTDDSWQIMRQQMAQSTAISLLRLSRNFGKEAAVSAGLAKADADVVVVIDSDLQDPPELIPQLIARWRDGADVVYAKRLSRAGESWLKRATASAFYRTIGRISEVPVPADTGDFRLLSCRAVAAVNQFGERRRFMKGLFAWIGFEQQAVDYDREPRAGGASKFSYWKLWNFALDGITSLSAVPLQVFSYLGLVVAVSSFGFGLWIIAKTLLWGEPVQGYPSLMVVISFLGGMQLLALGVIGEYLARVFEETRARPLYLVDEYLPAVRAEVGKSP